MVAATNDPSILDAAILKRPGRFDRVIAFRSPNSALRSDYLYRLTCGEFDAESLKIIAAEAEGLSFAQLRDGYILAGQLAFDRGRNIQIEYLKDGFRIVREQTSAVKYSDEVSNVGFAAQRPYRSTFLALIIRILKPEGRAAVVLPCAATITAFWTSFAVPVKRPAVWVWANTPINEAKRIQSLMIARMTWHLLPRVHPLLPDLGFLTSKNVSAPNWLTVTSGAPPGALDSRIADQCEAVPTSDPL